MLGQKCIVLDHKLWDWPNIWVFYDGDFQEGTFQNEVGNFQGEYFQDGVFYDGTFQFLNFQDGVSKVVIIKM